MAKQASKISKMMNYDGEAVASAELSTSTAVSPRTFDVQVSPRGTLEMLSQAEVAKLRDAGHGGLYEVFRRCSLAVLNSGSDIDDAARVLEQHRDFDVEIVQRTRGFKLKIRNAPANAFVDGEMIKGIKELLFAVLRDVVYIGTEITESGKFDLRDSKSITNAVFHILRNARIFDTRLSPNLVVCWGGHSIGREEYEYTKKVGYELGLRGLNICTGCGPGAMKGPMKGATIGHSKQRIRNGRYIGISEPGIIAAESPNPIVNHLVVMPDIEKRLEAFVRTGHGIVVFPGGVGTAEEILFLLGVFLHPDNEDQEYPFIFTGPRESEDYFQKIDQFISATLGERARKSYRIILDDPAAVAREMSKGVSRVRQIRRRNGDAFYFNWLLNVEKDFQVPFEPSHENMSKLVLHRDMELYVLAANLRRAFSGIVAGNVKNEGIHAIKRHGPFEIRGEEAIMKPLDDLLRAFVAQNRMKLADKDYTPCYRLVS